MIILKYPPAFDVPTERLLVWQKRLLNESEVSFRKIIEEQRQWNAEMMKAVQWNAEQFELARARVSELENWTTELEKAKRYHEERAEEKDRQIGELEELGKKREDEIRELRQALRTKIAKPWHQKLLHGSKESDYGL